MVLGTAVDLSVLSYPVPVIMKEQGAVTGRDRAYPRTLGGAELALSHQARQSQPSAIERGGVCPQTSGEAESNPRGLGEAQLYGQEVQLRSCLLESINV